MLNYARNLLSSLRRKPPEASSKKINLWVTLWPNLKEFPHFPRFANDSRISAIRLNSAKISNVELTNDLEQLSTVSTKTPMYFDAKGRQPRVTWVDPNQRDYLVLHLNHPISVKTPVRVLFKAGADSAVLERLEGNGQRLIFRGGPAYMVTAGESIHIRDNSFIVNGDLFTDEEKLKLEQVRKAGFKNYFLSYVELQRDIDEFRELVGNDTRIMLKIENQKGLDFVANGFRKTDQLSLVAARGDMYVELEWQHQMIDALKLIIEKDSEACVGSRILLSVAKKLRNKRTIQALKLLRSGNLDKIDPDKIIEKALLCNIDRDIPSCADFCELAWLQEVGYQNVMLCDEICLYEDLLDEAVGAFEAFRYNKV